MVKKKLLALGISAVAVTAVVGAGFAGWTFTSEAKAEKNFGVNVTAAYSFGTVAIDPSAPDTVVLDQSGITLAATGALDTAIAEVTATWTVNTASYTDAKEAGLTYAVNVYVNTALSTYVNCGATTAEATSSKTGYTQYKIAVTPADSDITTSGDNTVVTMKVSNPLAYTSSKPDSFEDYQAMIAAISGVASGETTAVSGATDVVTDKEYSVAATDAPVIIEFTVTKTTD